MNTQKYGKTTGSAGFNVKFQIWPQASVKGLTAYRLQSLKIADISK